MSAQFRTRKQLEEARKSGDIRGWFGKLPRGRPPKEIAVPAEAPVQSTVSESGRSDLSSETSSRGSKNCTSWNSDESFPFLRDAVVSSKAGLPAVGLVASVPRPTTIRMTSLFESAAEEYGVDIGSVTREMVYKQKRKSLLSLDEIAFLQNVIQYRDEANQGMTRDEVISLIMELKQTSKRKTCENHLDYLIRTGRLSDLKRGGRVTKAQATTVKRSQINVEQQRRWNITHLLKKWRLSRVSVISRRVVRRK